MIPEMLGGVITVSLAILAHGAASIWWAAKTQTTLQWIQRALADLRAELSKRDDQINALWRRLDEVRDLVTKECKP